MSAKKDSFKDRMKFLQYRSWIEFLQQRLNAFRPQWTPRNLKCLFLTFGVLFAAITIPLWFIASEVTSLSVFNCRRMNKWFSMMDINIKTIPAILTRIMQTKNVQYALLVLLNVDRIYLN